MMTKSVIRFVLVCLAVAAMAGISATPQAAEGQAPLKVVILVVDDFTGAAALETADDDDLPPEDSDELCAVNLPEIDVDGQGHYDIDGTSMLHLLIDLYHGDAVAGVIGDSHLPTNTAIPECAPALTNGICWRKVDVGGYTLDHVTTALQTAKALDTGTNVKYVVNMSFAIIPCSELRTYYAYVRAVLDAGVANLNVAVQDLLTAYESTHNRVRATWSLCTTAGALSCQDDQEQEIVRQVCSAVCDAGLCSEEMGQECEVAVGEGFECDYVLDWLISLQDLDSSECISWSTLKPPLTENTVAVAASGNAGRTYPYFPAALPFVVSVSSTRETPLNWDDLPLEPEYYWQWYPATPSALSYSNWGEVLMKGGWFFEDKWRADFATMLGSGTRPDGTPLSEVEVADLEKLVTTGAMHGTSFAAPRLSAAVAWYLYNLGQYSPPTICLDVVGDGSMGLTYIDWNTNPGRSEVNWPLDVAAGVYCPNMDTGWFVP